ncbi:MAG: hypothetical protein ABI780_09495 [Ardenticatenales bacterium]
MKLCVRPLRRTIVATAFALGAAAGIARAAHTAPPVRAQAPTPAAAPTAVSVGGRIAAENACYVRLPNLPKALYGGFGAYNAASGVLTMAGGAERRSQDNTIALSNLSAIKLSAATAAWSDIPYGGGNGYSRATDHGCWGAANVQVSPTNWVSIMGKDGCDNGAFDATNKKGGDIKELQIGDRASGSGVRWVPNSGAKQLIGDLEARKGVLAWLFGAYDAKRDRLIFGQGSFNTEQDDLTRDEVYSAVRTGSKWQLKEMFPTGGHPVRRYGSCAAYVSDKDTGTDGVLVVGGAAASIIGAPVTTYNEVWWLDFAGRAEGEWRNITARFDNMDAFGPRREGACAYDADSRSFYSWMGFASAGIPDGAGRSSGAWRVNVSALSDANAKLHWDRLAPDNLTGVTGRRNIPSVWDPVNKRMFVLGGRTAIDEFSDVWAIYPDVTGEACQTLDPYAPFAGPPATPTTPVPPAPTASGPAPTARPTSAGASEPGPDDINPCPQLESRAPAAAVAAAIAAPNRIAGYGMRCQANLPAGPTNPYRRSLTLRNVAMAYHPLFNGFALHCGCP